MKRADVSGGFQTNMMAIAPFTRSEYIAGRREKMKTEMQQPKSQQLIKESMPDMYPEEDEE